MSTASPDTCADVAGVATQRAASSCDPYFRTASWRRRSWYAVDRHPLSTRSATPSSPAATAARRRASRSAESSRVTVGTSSHTDTPPSGVTPSSSSSEPRCSRVRSPWISRSARSPNSSDDVITDDEDVGTTRPTATAIPTMTMIRAAIRRRRIRVLRFRRPYLREAMPSLKAAAGCCRVSGFRYARDTARLVA